MARTAAEKKEFIDWLSSPAGPSAAPFLRRIRTADGKIANLPSPPFVKVIALRRHAKKFNVRTFAETGTFMGNTTAALIPDFDELYTIELSEELHRAALARSAQSNNVHCLQGDSGTALGQVLQRISSPALFWLDAHFSGGVTANAGYDPINAELDLIFSHPIKEHVVLVDDARGHAVDAICASAEATHDAEVKNDIIRLTPNAGSVEPTRLNRVPSRAEDGLVAKHKLTRADTRSIASSV